jgi:hypothetical protein
LVTKLKSPPFRNRFSLGNTIGMEII